MIHTILSLRDDQIVFLMIAISVLIIIVSKSFVYVFEQVFHILSKKRSNDKGKDSDNATA